MVIELNIIFTIARCAVKKKQARSDSPLCYDNARIFHFLTFIYHVYYYSWSHDRRAFISHMTHYESFLELYFPHDSS
jgi:hypothetical protein